VQASKVRNNAAITDKEDQGLLQKKKPRLDFFEGTLTQILTTQALMKGPTKKTPVYSHKHLRMLRKLV
jgi:hypothetical protein